MKEEKFKVIDFIRELIVAIDEQLENFAKKDIELKNRIRSNTYDILELAYYANTTTDNEIKKDLLNKCIAKIKVIDFLVNLSYDKQLINSKKYYTLGQKMDDIVKYLIGWLKSVK